MPEDMAGAGIAEAVDAGTGAETSEIESQGTTTESAGQNADNQGQAEQENQEISAKSGKKSVHDLVKANREKLKAIDPSLPNLLQNALMVNQTLLREFPGGVKEAIAARDALSEIGGVEGIKEREEALGEYQSLEGLFEAGNPEFMTRLADTLPQSFSQMMPGGLEKWREVDPEMYNHVQARVMMNTLDGMKLSDTLEALWSRLDPQKQGEEREALAHLWKTLNGFRQSAEKAPERKKNAQDEALSRREQEIAQREQRAVLAPVAQQGKAQIQSIVDREMTASYQWAQTDSSVKEAVQDRVRQEVMKASVKDKNFCRLYDQYKARGDAQGLGRHIKQFQDKVTPAIAQRVAKLFAVKPKGAVKQVAAQTQQAKPADRGWERVRMQPTIKEIDRSKTSDDMVMDGKAVLKNGRKVIWA